MGVNTRERLCAWSGWPAFPSHSSVTSLKFTMFNSASRTSYVVLLWHTVRSMKTSVRLILLSLLLTLCFVWKNYWWTAEFFTSEVRYNIPLEIQLPDRRFVPRHKCQFYVFGMLLKLVLQLEEHISIGSVEKMLRIAELVSFYWWTILPSGIATVAKERETEQPILGEWSSSSSL